MNYDACYFETSWRYYFVKLGTRPRSETDFNLFLADWLACYQKRANSHKMFIFVVDARALEWHIQDIRYAIQLNAFVRVLHAIRQTFPGSV